MPLYLDIIKDIPQKAEDGNEGAREELRQKAESLDLPIFTSEEYKSFIKMLGEKVNKYIEW